MSCIRERDITSGDVDLTQLEENMFVAFYTGYMEEVGYGNRTYFSQHPQLSDELIDELLKRNVSIIALDCAGVRRGSQHTPKDQYCADHNCFVVENLSNLQAVLRQGSRFVAHTYPMNFSDVTGLPCRVIAEVDGIE